MKAFAGVVPGVPDGTPRPTVYGRRTGRWLQYWMFFAAEGQDRGVLTGRHAGDWEIVQYGSATASWSAASTASTTARSAARSRAIRTRTDRPLVFLANGSHAAYFVPGMRDRPWPDPNDEADGEGLRVRPRLVRITGDTRRG